MEQEYGGMPHLNAAEQARLAELVPTYIRLDAIDQPTVYSWVSQLTDHERALLLTWAIRYGYIWPAPAANAPS